MGKKQRRDFIPADCTQQEVRPQASRRTEPRNLSDPWAPPRPQVLNPHLPQLCTDTWCALPHEAAIDSPSRLGAFRKQATICGQGETINLSYSAIFWKTKERFPLASLVTGRNQRRHNSLRILPQEGARGVEQVQTD